MKVELVGPILAPEKQREAEFDLSTNPDNLPCIDLALQTEDMSFHFDIGVRV